MTDNNGRVESGVGRLVREYPELALILAVFATIGIVTVLGWTFWPAFREGFAWVVQ